MRWLVLLIPVLLIVTGCAGEPTPATRPEGTRVEIKHEIQNLETLRFDSAQNADHGREEKPLLNARVMEAYVYDDDAIEVRHDVLAKAIPQVVAGLDGYEKDAPPVLVRIYVVTGGDPNEAWTTSMAPNQLRAISRLPEPERAATLKRLAWGYRSRQREE